MVGHGVILAILSVSFWAFFERVLHAPDPIGLATTAVLISGLFVWFLIGFLLWKEKILALIGSILIVAPILLLGTNWGVLAGMFCVIGLLFWAARLVQKEQKERVVFSVTRSLLVAKHISVFALVLALSLGYFFSVQALSWNDLIPRFRLQTSTVTRLAQWLGVMQPELGELGKQEATVDDYLRSLNQKESRDGESGSSSSEFHELDDQLSQLRDQGIKVEFSGDALTSLQEASEESALTMGREQLSEVAGRPVRGDEQIAAVFGEVLENKFFVIFQTSRLRERIPDRVLPLFAGALFFLTIWPIALLLFSLWSRVASLVFRLLRSAKWVIVRKQLVEQETILI